MKENLNIILTEQDIINTYDEYQREQARLYTEYKRVKQENPGFGYKRISKMLGQPYAKTRWWHAKKYIPVPIRTVEWLKERQMLPLSVKSPKIPLLAKIIGATFGDGGIDINLNTIFLSSSEIESLEDFKQDLIYLFGSEIEKNFSVIVSGVNKTGHCIRNVNRNVIRFFNALGVPRGNKTKQILKIPDWIYLNETFEDQFYFSFFGSEIGIPRYRGGQLNTFDIAIGGLPLVEENRIFFLTKIKEYLNRKGIQTGKICINRSLTGMNQKAYMYRLLISTTLDNVVKFHQKIQLNYCYYKNEKLKVTIHDLIRCKATRFKDLRAYYNWDDKTILKKLNIKDRSIIRELL